MVLGTRDPEVPAAAATGSGLVVISRWQAHTYQQAIAASALDDPAPPLGWNPTGRHGAPVGYDLVLATPRTLSALVGWRLPGTDWDLTDEIMRAHFTAVRDVAMEFCAAVGAETPVRVSHCFDSAGQSWLHHHVLCGVLACLDGPDESQHGGREVWLPLDQPLVVRMAERMIFGYHLLLRQAVTPLIGELGLRWGALASDGSCELWGCPPGLRRASACRPGVKDRGISLLSIIESPHLVQHPDG
jgi:hypothetical protein